MAAFLTSMKLNSTLAGRQPRGVLAGSRDVRTSAAAAPTIAAHMFNDGSATRFAPIINGCWQLQGGHGRDIMERGAAEDVLQTYAAAGLTTYDTADIYGRSESVLGSVQSAWTASGQPPLQIFTKYVPNIFREVPKSADVEAAVRQSLSALQVDALDCVQLHWWDYSIDGMIDAALCLTDLRSRGMIRSVGATNMNVDALQRLIDADVPIVCNQVQFSMLDRRPLNGMLEFCKAKGIHVFAYGSVAGGLLSDKYVETPRSSLFGGVKYSNVDLNTSSLKMYWNTVKAFGGQPLWRDLLSTLADIAQKHQVDVTNVALRWLIQQGGPQQLVQPIVGVRSTRNLHSTLRTLEFELDEKDMNMIDEILDRADAPVEDCFDRERGQ